MKKVMKSIGKVMASKLVNKILNGFLIVYGVICIIGGLFYDIEVSAANVGIWVLLTVFHFILGDRMRDNVWELVDNKNELVDMLVEHNNRLREELTKNKK